MSEGTMAQFTDRDKERLHDMWAIVTNGLRDNVRKLAEQYEHLNETMHQTLSWIGSEDWHEKHCPILKGRATRKKSWDWMLVVGVSTTSILMNIATVILIVTQVM